MCNLESVYTYEGTNDIHTLVLGEVEAAGVEHKDAKPLTLEETGFHYSG